MSLLTSRPQRVHFNPKDKAHLKSLQTFLETGQWGEVKFAAEAPYINVPEYVLRKYSAHQLKCKDGVMEPNVGSPLVKEEPKQDEAKPTVKPALVRVA